MASGTMRQNRQSRKNTHPHLLNSKPFSVPNGIKFNTRVDHPDWRVEPLRDYVRRVYADAFTDRCEYRVEGHAIIRETYFLGDIADSRKIGEIPSGMVGRLVRLDICTGWIIGEPAAIEKARLLERQEWKIKRRLAMLFATSKGGAL